MTKPLQNSIQQSSFHSFSHLFKHYGLILLLSMVLLYEFVGIRTRNQPWETPQESQTVQEDNTKTTARKLFEEARELFDKGTAESQRQAIVKLEEALQLWQQVDDQFQQAFMLAWIGYIYDSLGEKLQALTYYNQALPLYRAVGNKTEEGLMLYNIGLIFYDLGEQQQALKYYNQALALHREVDNKKGEAHTLNNIGLIYASVRQRQQALKYYNQALALYRELGDNKGEANTLNNIRNLY